MCRQEPGDELRPDGDWDVTLSPACYDRILELCTEGSATDAAIRLILVAVRGMR